MFLTFFCSVTNDVNVSDLTLKEAVEFLSQSEENFQQCGATVIQHSTFKEDQAKQEVTVHTSTLHMEALRMLSIFT